MAVGLVENRAVVGVVGVSEVRPTAEGKFQRLVLALKDALGPSSGVTSDDVDVAYLTRLMGEYDADDEGWQPYSLGDASRGYTRNLVDEGNGKSNLVRPRHLPSPRQTIEIRD